MRPNPSRSVLRACLVSAALAVSVPGTAQQPADERQTAGSPTTQELDALEQDIAAARERLVPLIEAIDVTAAEAWLARSPLDELEARIAAARDSAARADWQTAADIEAAAAEPVREALRRAELARSGPERLRQAERSIEPMRTGASAGIDEQSPLSRIEQEITALNNRRADAALELDERRETLAQLESQRRSQAETLNALRREREARLAAFESGPEPGEAGAAVREARARRIEAQIIAAQLVTQTLPARLERLPLEIRARELELRWLDAQLRALRDAFNQRSSQEMRTLGTELQRLMEDEPDLAQRFPERVEALRGLIDELGRAQSRIRELRAARGEHEAVAEDLRQTLANVRERVEIGGLSEALGGLFLEEQRRLRALEDEEYELRDVERELAQSRLRSITLRERLEAVPTPSADASTVEAELRELEREAVGTLLETRQSLTEQLRRSEAPLRTVVSLVDELGQLLRETLLWWPSHRPVGADWAERVPAAIGAALNVAGWEETRTALSRATIGNPLRSLVTLLLVALLYSGGRRARHHLRQIAEKTRHRYTDTIGLTFRAIGWTVLRALPVPLLLMFCSYELRHVPETGPGVETLSAVLFNAAIWWLAGHLFLLFTSRNGVGTAHLLWSPWLMRRLRRNLIWYIPTQFVLVVSLGLALGHPDDLVFDVFGRAALVLSSVVSGLLIWTILAPAGDIHTAAGERWRRLTRVAATAYALGLVGLALSGYLLTVSELLSRTIYTACVIGAGWLGYRFAMRALKLSEIRLEVRRKLEERANAAALEGSGAAIDAAADDAEPLLSIEDINAQTRKLLTVATGSIVALALFGVWADVLPALTWLDSVTLWSRTIAVGDTQITSAVSVQDALLACLLGVLFVMAARNLPGLVEIVLARSTGMDAPGRYTVAMLLRYVLVVVGTITAFGLLGLRWAELQWMVAALTLGLGFGLQEVVANFFSGLVMLFERPVRVGDTITIGEFSGTVARIRTRATTITDWDNREVVVPNKMFITERLINWTLSDSTTRIVLPVGVSYDADVDAVTAVLLEAAGAHPLVLEEPEPQVLLLRFGESSMSFELRAYVAQMDDRLPVISDLHFAIIHAFRARGITIAYPQIDLHIKDAPAGESPTSVGLPAVMRSGAT